MKTAQGEWAGPVGAGVSYAARLTLRIPEQHPGLLEQLQLQQLARAQGAAELCREPEVLQVLRQPCVCTQRVALSLLLRLLQ